MRYGMEKEVTAITALLQAGANVNAKDAEGGQSPLHYAVTAVAPEDATAAIKTLLAAVQVNRLSRTAREAGRGCHCIDRH
jgi:ankyrin repeat protein